jgi:hypothetical protein
MELMKYITMNKKELKQVKVFEQIVLGIITKNEAATQLGFTGRWIREKFKRYVERDDFGLIHKNRGRASAKKWNEKNEQLLIDLLNNEWYGFGPTFAAEKLEEIHSIKVSREVVRKVMIKANLWQSK